MLSKVAAMNLRVPILPLVLIALVGCGDGADGPEGPAVLTVDPGEGIGPVRLGMSKGELFAAVGAPDTVSPFNRLITLQYETLGLEVILTSSDARTLTEDARVRGIGTLPGALVEGPLVPGQSRAAVETLHGAADIDVRGVLYFVGAGLAATVDEAGAVTRFAVWPRFGVLDGPAPMLSAQTRAKPLPVATDEETPRFEFQGERYEVVDMHLHAGRLSGQVLSGLEYLLAQLPEPSLLYFPAASGLVIDPYGEHVGIQAHLRAVGIAHGVLLAAYTQKTIGFTENRLLEAFLDDPRNTSPDGLPWSWGLASIDFEGFEAPAVAAARLDALASYFETRPDVFIGIKLAHAHQAVTFDDPLYLGVYDIAARYGVPVLLHTGITPFPNAKSESEYYDPASLAAVVEAYDGEHGNGRVDFVLGHAGRGDARAINSSLDLAAENDNVWLEISLINAVLSIDENGNPVQGTERMHRPILEQIKARGLIDRTIFASDGPQYFGKIRGYLSLIVSTMVAVGYTPAEIQMVLADNFYRCFQPPGR